jgi:parallel beta-helix repeat protein
MEPPHVVSCKPTKIMKTKLLITGLALLALSTLNQQLSTCFAQGSLTPPGSPAPTMKSADQIEPRTIVNAANTPGDANNLFSITNSGSYYLTTNLVSVSGKNGIEIIANNVTLDLNGFALLGASGGLSGITIPNAQTNITARNGSISGWNYGVNSCAMSTVNMVLERLNVYGCADDGIYLNGAGVVRDCNCQKNGEYGIFCYGGGIISGCTADNNYGGISIGGASIVFGTVSGCTADNNNDYGINVVSSGTVSGCTANNNNDSGINVNSGTVSGCTANNNNDSGIQVTGTVSGCTADNNNYDGIIVTSGSVVIGNTCIGNNTANSSSFAAISIYGSNSRIEDNHVSASGYAGIMVYNDSTLTNNIIIKNSVFGSGANNYIIPVGQIVGPIITNTVSGIITNSNPWANFSF